MLSHMGLHDRFLHGVGQRNKKGVTIEHSNFTSTMAFGMIFNGTIVVDGVSGENVPVWFEKYLEVLLIDRVDWFTFVADL
jgi:hypothetical protein